LFAFDYFVHSADLLEKLNMVRMNDLSARQHSRVIILESALANVNHGNYYAKLVSHITFTTSVLSRPGHWIQDRRRGHQQGYAQTGQFGPDMIRLNLLSVLRVCCQLAMKVVAVGSTLLPIGIAISVQFGTRMSARGTGACVLTSQQDVILEEMGRMLIATGFNRSECHYNITLDELLERGEKSLDESTGLL
jgi:hypothetical protein